jgi:hypothetical protein
MVARVGKGVLLELLVALRGIGKGVPGHGGLPTCSRRGR